MTRPLTAAEIDAYHTTGYLGGLRVLSSDEVAKARRHGEQLVARLGGAPRPADMVQPHLHFRWAFDLATHPAVLAAVESLLGPDLLVHSSSLFYKPPRSLAFVAWHQDGLYWRLSRPAVASAWIALTDSTRETGCMRVLPGSHAAGALPYTDGATVPENLLASGLRTTVTVDEAAARAVELCAGEMSLHHVDLLHASAPNASPEPRMGLAVRYVPPSVSQQLPHHDVVLARGRDDHHHYTLRHEPPATDFEEGVSRQREFADRWHAFRSTARHG
ncbi:MAG: phytanoyl-CoA dioxygenase family protein [Deltaproteobacteria bacterium]|nr:MAG: phytanoyl-CoA dioxygenase family protein [Deltaproteobacteria bacterium]TMQ12431.1 MAG: phytanoyl-CoA dioxygenase family protein [Deltaproteobacteria bacterium]